MKIVWSAKRQKAKDAMFSLSRRLVFDNSQLGSQTHEIIWFFQAWMQNMAQLIRWMEFFSQTNRLSNWRRARHSRAFWGQGSQKLRFGQFYKICNFRHKNFLRQIIVHLMAEKHKSGMFYLIWTTIFDNGQLNSQTYENIWDFRSKHANLWNVQIDDFCIWHVFSEYPEWIQSIKMIKIGVGIGWNDARYQIHWKCSFWHIF